LGTEGWEITVGVAVEGWGITVVVAVEVHTTVGDTLVVITVGETVDITVDGTLVVIVRRIVVITVRAVIVITVVRTGAWWVAYLHRVDKSNHPRHPGRTWISEWVQGV